MRLSEPSILIDQFIDRLLETYLHPHTSATPRTTHPPAAAMDKTQTPVQAQQTPTPRRRGNRNQNANAATACTPVQMSSNSQQQPSRNKGRGNNNHGRNPRGNRGGDRGGQQGPSAERRTKTPEIVAVVASPLADHAPAAAASTTPKQFRDLTPKNNNNNNNASKNRSPRSRDDQPAFSEPLYAGHNFRQSPLPSDLPIPGFVSRAAMASPPSPQSPSPATLGPYMSSPSVSESETESESTSEEDAAAQSVATAATEYLGSPPSCAGASPPPAVPTPAMPSALSMLFDAQRRASLQTPAAAAAAAAGGPVDHSDAIKRALFSGGGASPAPAVSPPQSAHTSAFVYGASSVASATAAHPQGEYTSSASILGSNVVVGGGGNYATDYWKHLYNPSPPARKPAPQTQNVADLLGRLRFPDKQATN
jgi:hypothetical protein